MLMDHFKSELHRIDRQLEAFLPERIDARWVADYLHGIEFDLPIMNELIRPVRDFVGRGGKRWRPLLMILCCEAVGGNPEIDALLPVVEIIHNGTLVIDDIEDDSDTRRGHPCMHKTLGVDVSINTGNLMYYLPFLVIRRADLDPAVKGAVHAILCEEMYHLSIGQGMDIYWHNGGDRFDEPLYLRMCSLKTGALARMAARIGALLGGATAEQTGALERFTETLGVAFQIQDDILNVMNPDWGKDFGEDISEGKRTLMVIKALDDGSEADRRRLTELLAMKTKEGPLIEEAIAILKRYGTLEYAKEKAVGLVEEAWNRLDSSIDDSLPKKKLKLFSDFVVHREW